MQLLNSELTDSAREHRERKLLERIAARDREAMREFYLLYGQRLARFLSRMTRRDELLDEMINDTLAVVWEKAGDFRGDSRVATWILGIAYRHGLNLLRGPYRAQKRTILQTIEERHLQDPVAEPPDLAELLERAMASLSPDHRALLELTYDLGHSCGEIAAIMGCPINAVKTRMLYARNKLRGLMPVLAAAGPVGEAHPRLISSQLTGDI